MPSASEQLASFIARFSPAVARQTRAAVSTLRKRHPAANLLVYDNYNALAIGFCGSERTSEISFSIAVYPRWVSLFLMHGPSLHDPKKLLRGSGSTVRHIAIEELALLKNRDVLALIDEACARSKSPIAKRGRGKVIVKSISAKQRPRR